VIERSKEMTRRTWLTATLGTVGIVGIVPRKQMRAQNAVRPLADVVADRERAFAASMAKRDLGAFSALLSTEAVFFSSPDGLRVLRGRSAIVEGWKRFFEGPTPPFSWSPETAQVLDSGTLAMTTGPVRDENGKQTGRFSSVWRLEADGQWRVIFDRGCACPCAP
jgi:ketosteroid isomerase-like protein